MVACSRLSSSTTPNARPFIGLFYYSSAITQHSSLVVLHELIDFYNLTLIITSYCFDFAIADCGSSNEAMWQSTYKNTKHNALWFDGVVRDVFKVRIRDNLQP
jgi:hypothetical protein